MGFIEKLDYLMAREGLNKNTLSKACGIPYTTIDGWYKKGYEGLKLTTLRKLASFFGTSLDFWVAESNDALSQEQSGIRLSLSEQQYIKKYRQLDSRGRKNVDDTLEREYNYAMGEAQVSDTPSTGAQGGENHLSAGRTG